MKKYRVLFFLLIVLAGMMVLLSCRTEPQKDTDQESISKDGLVFEESYHSRDGFLDRSFACLTAEYGGAQYCVDQLIQEETAKSIVESIDRFVSQVRDYLKQDSKRGQTILIVHDKDKAIAYTNDQGDTAVISDLAVSEGICDPVLLRVFFSEKITNWMSYGLRGLLSEAANDENTLFSEAVEWNEIGPACYPGLNSIDEIKDTGDIAASLMQEILREHGKEVLVDFILNMNRGERCGLLRELFRKNGIKYAPDERLIFADFTANEKYEVIVNLPEYSIQIKTNHEDAYDIKNASDIAVFIAYVDRTYKKIAENVRKDFSGSGMALDESYYTIEINEEDGLHAEGAGQTFPEERRISLKQKPHLSLPHEFVHLLTGTFATGWLAEGYA
ncbi:MAG: hypothetical protein J6U42_07670, partial [Lachnospiraceae bacterium]|nr:hypothetical protein [Lachnospiraceae bacterium]